MLKLGVIPLSYSPEIQFYKCTVPKLHYQFSVPPQISPFDFGEDPINSGDLTSVQCAVHKGDLPIKIKWYHNGKPVNEDLGIVISKIGKKISTLSIEDVQAQHSGNYTCAVENSAGQAQFTAELYINGTTTLSFTIIFIVTSLIPPQNRFNFQSPPKFYLSNSAKDQLIPVT